MTNKERKYDYRVVQIIQGNSPSDLEKFENAVNEKIAEGYKPTGGINVSKFTGEEVWVLNQSVVKKL